MVSAERGHERQGAERMGLNQEKGGSLRRRLNRLSDLQRSTIGSMLSGSVSQGGLLISGVLSSRILGPEDRGYLALLILVPVLLCHLGSLGLPLAATFFVGRTPARSGAIARSLIKPGLVQVLVVGAVQVVIFRQFTEGRPAEVQVAAAFCILLLPSWLATEYGFALLKGQQRFGALNLVRCWASLLQACILLGLIVFGIAGLPQVAASWLIVSCLETVVTLVVVVRGLERTAAVASDPSVPQMMRFGLKALVGAISPIETLRLDQIMVGWLLSPVAVGIYVTAGTVTSLPRFIAQSIGVIAYPHVAAQGERGSAWRLTWRFFWVTLAISLAAAGLLAAAAGILIPFFFGEDFAEAVPVARILLLAAALASGRRVLADGARGLGFPALNTVVEIASWGLLIVAMIFLTERWGTIGVATALAITAGFGLALLVLGLVVVGRGGRRRATPTPQEDIANAQGY